MVVVASVLEATRLGTPLTRVGSGEGGVHQLVHGVLRWELDGTVFRRASELLGGLATSAVRSERGWLFASSLGSGTRLQRADTFLGPLREHSILPTESPVQLRTSPAFELAFTGQQLWRVDAEHGAVACEIPAWSDIQDVRFTSATEGVLLNSLGSVLVTHDACAHWSEATPVGVGALQLGTRADAVAVRTLTGTYLVRPNGTLEPTDHATFDAPLRTPPAVTEAWKRSRARAACLLTGPMRPGAPSQRVCPANGDFEDSRDLVVLNGETGAVVETLASALPVPRCTVRAWGNALGAICGNGRVYRSTNATEWTPVGDQSFALLNLQRFAFSSEGTTAVLAGPCGDRERHSEEESPPSSALFCFWDGTSWKQIETRPVAGLWRNDGFDENRFEYPPPERRDQSVMSSSGRHGQEGEHLLDLRGDQLLVTRVTDGTNPRDGGSSEPTWVSLRDKTVKPVLEITHIDRKEWDNPMLGPARFTPDGRVSTALHFRDHAVLWRGDGVAPAQTIALPETAYDAVMLDATHGYAIGDEPLRGWSTEDGGLHWEEQDVGAIPWLAGRFPVMNCSDHACVVRMDEVALVLGTVPAAAADALVSLPSGTELGLTQLEPWRDREGEFVGYFYEHRASQVCRVKDAPRVETTTRTLLPTAKNEAVSLVRATADTSRVRWTGTIGRARRTLTSQPFAAAVQEPDVTWWALSASPTQALIERCKHTGATDVCQLFRAVAGGAVTEVAFESKLPLMRGMPFSFAHELADRSLLVFTPAIELAEDRQKVRSVFKLTPDGAVQAVRHVLGSNWSVEVLDGAVRMVQGDETQIAMRLDQDLFAPLDAYTPIADGFSQPPCTAGPMVGYTVRLAGDAITFDITTHLSSTSENDDWTLRRFVAEIHRGPSGVERCPTQFVYRGPMVKNGPLEDIVYAGGTARLLHDQESRVLQCVNTDEAESGEKLRPAR